MQCSLVSQPARSVVGDLPVWRVRGKEKPKYSGLEAVTLPAPRERKEEEESTANVFSNVAE